MTVVAAGDMACDVTDRRSRVESAATDQCQAQRVSDVAVGLHPDYLLGLGDYQYEVPAAAAYREVYGPGWGRLRDVTIPAIGNQEYKVHDANTFHDYFGERSGPDSGYWSTDVGCVARRRAQQQTARPSRAGAGGVAAQQRGSRPTSRRATPGAPSSRSCTTALVQRHRRAGHPPRRPRRHPRRHGVDLMLSGHEANYERFTARDAQGRPSATGIVQMVAGNAARRTTCG